MRKEASLPVRLDADVKERLRQAADVMGMTVSALIRLLVKSFVEEFEHSGGKIVMPPRWNAGLARGAERPDDPAEADRPHRIAAETRARYGSD